MTNSVLQELKSLDARRTALLDRAKKEALVDAEKAVKVLNSLGFNYQLVDSGAGRSPVALKATKSKRKVSRKKSRKGTRTPKDEPCPICKFKTSPPHDRRTHRMQKSKKPFSAKELAERGYSKT